MRELTVLIPTYNRVTALAATLTSLFAQEGCDFDVLISDQGDVEAREDATVQTVRRILDLHNRPVSILSNRPRRGIAHQRQFLLDRCESPFALFMDDDIILEKDVIIRMLAAIKEEECGFVGMGLIGLSFAEDERPSEQVIEFWDGKVQPEVVRPRSREWDRYKLHNAANLLHVNQQHSGSAKYKVAWVGGCILYDVLKLREVGGFSFWSQLPADHCGEDVLVQLRMMERFGGCGILPSGAYHQEQPTTIIDRSVNAPEFLR